jgi:hypothetical protein
LRHRHPPWRNGLAEPRRISIAAMVLAPATGALLYYSASLARWSIAGDSL